MTTKILARAKAVFLHIKKKLRIPFSLFAVRFEVVLGAEINVENLKNMVKHNI